jgi:hypothetical protein
VRLEVWSWSCLAVAYGSGLASFQENLGPRASPVVSSHAPFLYKQWVAPWVIRSVHPCQRFNFPTASERALPYRETSSAKLSAAACRDQPDRVDGFARRTPGGPLRKTVGPSCPKVPRPSGHLRVLPYRAIMKRQQDGDRTINPGPDLVKR